MDMNHMQHTSEEPSVFDPSFFLSLYGLSSETQCTDISSPTPGDTVEDARVPPAEAVEQPLPPSVSRCVGLEYANMRKERAREEYKEKRRIELLQLGEMDRVKRRKKNDTSMTESQRYNRRLKMNQDSAAAARHAQDVYVQTLEELVATAEKEKTVLIMEASSLRSERDDLARRLDNIQSEVVAAVPLVADANNTRSAAAETLPTPAVEEHNLNFDDSCDPASSAILLRKMIELFEAPESASALQTDPNFASGMFGIMPAPAV